MMLDIVWSGAAHIPLLIPICMAAVLMVCICGCRARDRKDELVGIEGHVKIHNVESVEAEVNGNNVDDRTGTTAQRSLPDLPVENAGGWDPSDTASELYATVGIKTVHEEPQIHDVTNSTPSSHAYDKLRGLEHAYAQVRPEAEEPTASPSASGSEILAAPAVAGRVHASADLPYMTPPTHFSGDSQDSAKGYTSISVREPLAQLRLETTERPPDRHYTTVSDDSDDMYAAIDEPQTYAKIKPDLPHQSAVSHSRQESCSSSGSAGLMSSPKPEKREANSPLPAPPADGVARNLDDMYAKVNKKKKRDLDELHEKGNSTESAVSGSSECVSYKLQSNPSTTDSSRSCASPSMTTESSSHTTHSCPSQNTTESPSTHPPSSTDSSLSSEPEPDTMDPCYQTVHNGDTRSKTEPNYATLEKGVTNFGAMGASDPNYETLTKRASSSDVDPNYETLDKGPPSDSDPNYERIGHNANFETDGYATVFHHMDTQYEVVRFNNKLGDPPYATVDPEPPYSSLGPRVSEPPYSTLGPKNNSGLEPPYQLLANCESGVTDKL